MDALLTPEDLDLAVIPIAEQPQTLSLPAGTALFALRGELWLTQAGRREDVMLRAGERYDASGRGAIVVSATQTPAALAWCPAVQARALPTADLPTLLRARAADLRRAARDQAINAVLTWLSVPMKSLSAAMRRALVPRGRSAEPRLTAAPHLPTMSRSSG